MHQSVFLTFLCAAIALALPAKNLRQNDFWKPSQGESFNYEIFGKIGTTIPNADVMGIDLFDNKAKNIAALQKNGARVICYFSAGTYENWRSDWTASDNQIGNDLPDWPGEWWADIRLQSVRDIMAARIKLAASKGCDAVDPDNMDGYDNDNGLDLTSEDAVDYMKFLASEAHSRGMSIGLKNALSIVDELTPIIDFAVNEQCHEYEECDAYANFVHAGKNVFHIEYPKGDEESNDESADPDLKAEICEDPDVQVGFSTVLKNINLDTWLEFCD